MGSKLTRRSFNSLALSAAISCSVRPLESRARVLWDKPQFVHPGMLHTREDLARMRHGVRTHREPIMSGFKVFQQHPNSQSTYMPLGPVVTMSRNPTVHVDLFDSDSNAAYQCALMWCITGDYAYAKVAIRILNGWTSTLKQISGADAVLCASLGGFKLINAAELIRHTDTGWRDTDAKSNIPSLALHTWGTHVKWHGTRGSICTVLSRIACWKALNTQRGITSDR